MGFPGLFQALPRAKHHHPTLPTLLQHYGRGRAARLTAALAPAARELLLIISIPGRASGAFSYLTDLLEPVTGSSRGMLTGTHHPSICTDHDAQIRPGPPCRPFTGMRRSVNRETGRNLLHGVDIPLQRYLAQIGMRGGLRRVTNVIANSYPINANHLGFEWGGD